MKTYGYARCSTNEEKQNLDRQIDELLAAGVKSKNDIYGEYKHGAAEHKEKLEDLMAIVEPGDEIITTEVSRLSRSTKQLCDLLEQVKTKKIRLVIKNSITLDCTKGKIDPTAAAFLQMAGVFAELEKAMCSARVVSGLENAKAKGKVLGRPKTTKNDIPSVFYKLYPLYKEKKMTITEIARACKISRPSIYKYIELVESK